MAEWAVRGCDKGTFGPVEITELDPPGLFGLSG